MCRREHERQRMGGARNVVEAGGGRKQWVVMEDSGRWSRDINIRVTRLATEGAQCPAQCEWVILGDVVWLASCPWGWVEQGLAPEVGARWRSVSRGNQARLE